MQFEFQFFCGLLDPVDYNNSTQLWYGSAWTAEGALEVARAKLPGVKGLVKVYDRYSRRKCPILEARL